MRFLGKRPVLFQSGQWHFHQDNAPVHVSIFVTEYLTKMGIKTVPQPPNNPDVAPCDFWLFPKLRVNHYETIEEMKDVLTKVIDTVTQEDVHGAFQKLLERYKCIGAGGVYFEWDLSFIWVLSTKVPIRKKSGNLFDDPRIYMCIMVKILRKNHFQTTKFLQCCIHSDAQNHHDILFMTKNIFFISSIVRCENDSWVYALYWTL